MRKAVVAAEIDLREETDGRAPVRTPARAPALSLEGADDVGNRGNLLVTLAAAPVGARVRLRYLEDGTLRAQAIRLGLGPGSEVTVWARLPGGPVLLSRGTQRIAVGHRLASRTWVEILPPGGGR